MLPGQGQQDPPGRTPPNDAGAAGGIALRLGAREKDHFSPFLSFFLSFFFLFSVTEGYLSTMYRQLVRR